MSAIGSGVPFRFQRLAGGGWNRTLGRSIGVSIATHYVALQAHAGTLHEAADMTTRANLLGIRDNDPFFDPDSEESISPKPRFRPTAIENPIERAGAVYAMRMIQGAKLHARLP